MYTEYEACQWTGTRSFVVNIEVVDYVVDYVLVLVCLSTLMECVGPFLQAY